jgi:hypothetical protein
VDNFLKCLQNGIQADAVFQGRVGILTKTVEQFGFIILVKGIHDLVGKAHEAVDPVDRGPQWFVEYPNAHTEAGAVTFGDEPRTLAANVLIEAKHIG